MSLDIWWFPGCPSPLYIWIYISITFSGCTSQWELECKSTKTWKADNRCLDRKIPRAPRSCSRHPSPRALLTVGARGHWISKMNAWSILSTTVRYVKVVNLVLTTAGKQRGKQIFSMISSQNWTHLTVRSTLLIDMGGLLDYYWSCGTLKINLHLSSLEEAGELTTPYQIQ